MSDFWKAHERACALARENKADACVVYSAGGYHARLLSKADPVDVVVEVADDKGVVGNRFERGA